jgi:hypothetical protein
MRGKHSAADGGSAARAARPTMGWGSCSGYAVLRGEKAPDDALARELGAMGLL